MHSLSKLQIHIPALQAFNSVGDKLAPSTKHQAQLFNCPKTDKFILGCREREKFENQIIRPMIPINHFAIRFRRCLCVCLPLHGTGWKILCIQ
jgi:hypothetical protein